MAFLNSIPKQLSLSITNYRKLIWVSLWVNIVSAVVVRVVNVGNLEKRHRFMCQRCIGCSESNVALCHWSAEVDSLKHPLAKSFKGSVQITNIRAEKISWFMMNSCWCILLLSLFSITSSAATALALLATVLSQPVITGNTEKASARLRLPYSNVLLKAVCLHCFLFVSGVCVCMCVCVCVCAFNSTPFLLLT